MNKLFYFLAVGLAFTALQVATVEASHDQAHVDEMRATEDSARDTARAAEDSVRQTMRETEDRTRQTVRDTEDSATKARRDLEDSDRQQAEEAMNTAAGGGDGGPDCEAMGAPGSAARTACEAGEGEHHEHDCSEIQDPAGLALCEKAKARGTPPTAAECALVGDPAECLRHAAGGGDGGPDCEAMGAPGSAARTACEAGPASGGDGGPNCEAMGAPGSAARTSCEAGQG